MEFRCYPKRVREPWNTLRQGDALSLLECPELAVRVLVVEIEDWKIRKCQ